MRRALLLSCALLIAAGCGGSNGDATPPQLHVSPQFINRLIPGHRPLGLVSIDQGGAVELTATVDLKGATASLEPAALDDAGVAEVWVDLPDTDQETPFTVTVTASRDDARSSVDVAAIEAPGTDDLAPMATDIAAVYLRDLAGSSGLPATVDELTGGTPVAGLLVVSHYAWFTDQYEIGLAWHIMIAPDDFSELYVRPRGELAPTQAWRIDSWSTALAGGSYSLTEIEPPAEVMR
jgi:hypothetical protein